MQISIYEFIKPKDKKCCTVLIDTADIVLQSNSIELAKKSYNFSMDFHLQFVLLYLSDALMFELVYYR